MKVVVCEVTLYGEVVTFCRVELESIGSKTKNNTSKKSCNIRSCRTLCSPSDSIALLGFIAPKMIPNALNGLENWILLLMLIRREIPLNWR